MSTETLPKITEINPNSKELMGELDAGRGVRLVKVGVVGHEYMQERPIAKSLAESKSRSWDYWDASLAADGQPKGWIRNGQYYERDIYMNSTRVQSPLAVYR